LSISISLSLLALPLVMLMSQLALLELLALPHPAIGAPPATSGGSLWVPSI
jgi:hypothetical protein